MKYEFGCDFSKIPLWMILCCFFIFVGTAQEKQTTDGLFNNLIASGDAKRESDWLGALEDYLKAEKIVLGLDNQKDLITVYEKLALLYYNDEDQRDELLSYSLEGLEMAKKEKDTARTIFFNRCAGTVYTRVDSFDLAKTHLMEALVLNEEVDDYFIRAAIYVDLAAMYSLSGEYDKAIDIYSSLEKRTIFEKPRYITDDREHKFNLAIVTFHYNWAKALYEKGDYEKSHDLINKTLKDIDSLDVEPIFVGISEVLLSMYHNKKKDWEKSARYGDSAMSFLKEVHREEFLDNGFQQAYSESLIMSGKYKKAMATSEYFEKREDSLSKEKLKRRIFHIEKIDAIRKSISVLEAQKHQATLNSEKIKSRSILYILLLCIAVFVLVVYRNRLKKNKLTHTLLVAKKEQMEYRLGQNKREITSKLIQMSDTKTTLLSLSEEINKIRSDDSLNDDVRERLSKILSKIKLSKNQNIWGEFEKRFEEINPEFYATLHERHPNLSRGERILCAYLKLNLTSKEIASISGNTTKAVEVSRSRLRKKLGISNNKDVNLNIYIRHLEKKDLS